jgi:signal transduction histidine kinase
MDDAPVQQQIAATVGELRLWQAAFDPRALVAEIERGFLANPDLPACVIIDDGRVLGLLSRRRLLAELSKPFGRDLYVRRPIMLLLEVLDADPLLLPAGLPVSEAVERALSRPGERAYEPVLVARDEVPGIVEVDLLMRHLIVEVQRTADELRTALGDLERARGHLVQSEKMAALGQLVAGVAHEINTPVGVALTAVTYLAERTGEFQRQFAGGQMRRSDLQSYVELAGESADLLRFNIQRAAQLIKSFKQVAVDQTSEQHRSFELRSYLEQLIASLTPEVRKAGHGLTLDCPDGIEMASYPGALAQVLSNLVANAMLHAYDKGAAGTIAISAAPAGDEVVLTVRDNGRGIPPEHLPRIYDPFFTTRRGEGGSGLGLHIVFNIVSETLRGRIACDSVVGEGTSFVATLPRRLPSSA